MDESLPAALGIHRPASGRPGRQRGAGDGRAVSATALGALVEHLPRRKSLVRLQHEPGRPASAADSWVAPARSCTARVAVPTWRAGTVTVDPVNRFGLVLFNSSGGPDQFSISGRAGPARRHPAGVPAAVAMIHSFSAADPTDPQTIAGRWLAQGAFVYFGSVYEPFLPAFRTPGLVAELAGGRRSAGRRLATRRIRAVRVSLAAGLPGRPAVSPRASENSEPWPGGRQGRYG